MRSFEGIYKAIFSLFTSFGYFNDEKDNQLAIDSIAKSLKREGIFVLDFMNCNKVIKQLNKEETKRFEDLTNYNTNLSFQSPTYEKQLFAHLECLCEMQNCHKPVYYCDCWNY